MAKLLIPKVSKGNWFVHVSAFHKELRRSDVAKAIYWGASLGVKNGFRYLKSITHEETQSTYLIEKIAELEHDITFDSFTRAVALFCLSPKRWERPYSVHKAVAEYESIFERVDRYPLGSEENTKYWIDQWQPAHQLPLKRLLEIYFGARGHEYTKGGYDFRKLFAESGEPYAEITAKAYHAGYEQALATFPYLARDTYQYTKEDREMMNWVWNVRVPEVINLAKAELDNRAFDIPWYAYDRHTSKGNAIYKREYHRLRHDKPFPIDMRYSGVMLSVYWRALAYSKFKTIHVEWESVVTEPEEIDIFYRIKNRTF